MFAIASAAGRGDGPRRWRRLALLLLAGLTAVPVLGATVPAGAAPAGRAAQAGPVTTPRDCVPDVEGQFDALKHHPESLAFNRANGAGEPSMAKHYQGISRLEKAGTPVMVLSRNGNPAPIWRPTGEGFEPGELLVVEMASRDASGERMRSNRMVPGQDINDTAPPAEDRSITSIRFDGTGQWPAYRHLGGMQTFGDVAIVGVDGRWNGNTVPGMVLLVDLADPANPQKLKEFHLEHQASWVTIGYINGRVTLLASGHNANPIYVYELTTDNLRDPTIDLRRIDLWNKDDSQGGGQYPTGFDSYQTANLYRDCATNQTYLLATYYDSPAGPWPMGGEDYMDMWRVSLVGNDLRLSHIRKRQLVCNRWNYAHRDCHFQAASGFHVTPAGELLLYGAEHEDEGPNSSVRFGEFAHHGGFRPGSPNFNPTAMAGDYTGLQGAAIQLDGRASVGAYAQAWVDLYDREHFGGHSLVIDHRDREMEDLANFSAADDFNDEASSVRWIAPVDCSIVLFEDRNFAKTAYGLDGNGGFQERGDLGRFDEKASSMRFEGDSCDGRVTSWRWDVGADGTIDAEGPTPTVTATAAGVVPLSLEVCTGWNTCHTATGSITVAGVASLPETTATLAGLAGENGWHRGPVTVTLTATGAPAPTEITYSATGAEHIPARTVAGTTAMLVVDNQGETTVSYRARNAAGEETTKTLTVRIDSIAPTVAIDAPIDGAQYTTGFQWQAHATCGDAGSGVDSCTTSTARLDTAIPGPKILEAAARDRAGNTATAEADYTVIDHPGGDGELVFVTGREGSYFGDVMRSNLDGTNLVRLHDGAGGPMWSPDGTRIAFVAPAGAYPNTRFQVFVMDADGTHVVQLTNDPANSAFDPAWSPAGTALVYATSRSDKIGDDVVTIDSLRTVAVTGGSPTVLVESSQTRLAEPVFSPDSSHITYVEGTSTLRSLPATGSVGGDLGDVLAPGGGIQSMARPGWAPDGSAVAFALNDRETGLGDLWLLAPGGVPVNLTGTENNWPTESQMDAPYEGEPTWLPDGRLAFVQDGDLWAVPAQRLAAKVRLADLPGALRHPDVRGA